MSDDIVKALLESLTPEQKEKLIKSLTGTTTEQSVETTEQTTSSTLESEVGEDFTVTRTPQTNRKSAVRARKNQWVDNGDIANDTDFDYEKFEKMKTPRKRSHPSKKKVECHVCGKTFAMNTNLIYGEFARCNKCTGR
tara:strand:+ start:618 stop:1031 length:414 start_codon:yes stop_codon:yes gene_type:complete